MVQTPARRQLRRPRPGDGRDGPYLVPTPEVLVYLNPFRDDVWGHGPLKRPEVTRALRLRMFETRHNVRRHRGWSDEEAAEQARNQNLSFDVRRVAYLVAYPRYDAASIDIRARDGAVVFYDGCHRIASSVYRRVPYILVEYGGYVDAFHDAFPGAIALDSPDAPEDARVGRRIGYP